MTASWPLTIALVLSASVAVLSRECKDNDEGKIVEKNCNGYTKCENGEPVNYPCDYGTVYDVRAKKCVEPGATTANCNLCFGKPDGSYADVTEDCKSYIICSSGKVVDTDRCEYILVFDEIAYICTLVQWATNGCNKNEK